MKLIDRKGRLFGKLNIVDLLVAILIAGFVAVVATRLYSQKLNANGGNPLSQQEEIYVTLYSSLVVPEIAESLKVGDKLVANNAYTNAEIVSIDVVPAAYVSTNSDGEAVLSEHPLWKDVTVVIKDTINPSSVILKAGNQEVRVGYSFILKTQTVETNCKIRGVEFASNSSSANYDLTITDEDLDISYEDLDVLDEDLDME